MIRHRADKTAPFWPSLTGGAAVLLCMAMLALAAITAQADDDVIIGEPDGKHVVTVRVPEAAQSKQALPIFPGISGKTAGAKSLSLLKVVIPPGGSAKAHVHKGYESAVYLIKGRVETRYGEGLKESVINEAGDFVFIPADVPHQPFNLSDNEPAIAIVARSDPDEQEHVILHDADESD